MSILVDIGVVLLLLIAGASGYARGIKRVVKNDLSIGLVVIGLVMLAPLTVNFLFTVPAITNAFDSFLLSIAPMSETTLATIINILFYVVVIAVLGMLLWIAVRSIQKVCNCEGELEKDAYLTKAEKIGGLVLTLILYFIILALILSIIGTINSPELLSVLSESVAYKINFLNGFAVNNLNLGKLIGMPII